MTLSESFDAWVRSGDGSTWDEWLEREASRPPLLPVPMAGPDRMMPVSYPVPAAFYPHTPEYRASVLSGIGRVVGGVGKVALKAMGLP